MSVAIAEVLRSLAESALDNRQKGDRLEALTLRVLTDAPLYTERYDQVHLWKDWPERDGRPDTGIDLVARQRDGGGWTAIQCKFYEPGHLIQKKDIDSFLSASGKEGFTERLIISTTMWGKNAQDTIEGQQVPVQRIDVYGWDDLGLEFTLSDELDPDAVPRAEQRTLRPHQLEALEAVATGMKSTDRGQLIMACGTGKTYTSLKIAESEAGAGGSVLFLVPSISLLSQTLTEWSREAGVPLRPFAVCSDVKVGRRNVDEDMSSVDLPEPATTNGAKLMERMSRSSERAAESMTVIFSTYQSIQAVHEAQANHGLGEFDLVVCDEAHRTTGVTIGGDASAFVRIHDADYIQAKKRMYMTATPRLYDEASKAKAGEVDAVLASMDDETTFGPEWHRLGFGDAVERDLLSDYKVLILAVDEATVAARFQQQWASGDVELNLDDTARLVGCWNGLAKEHLPELGTTPMRRAVAFAGNIKTSMQVADMVVQVGKECATRAEAEQPEGPDALRIEAEHVDGTFNILERNRLLSWLKEPIPDGENTCRILSNARCLSEGVDVPALDAVLFLNPRKSVVDVVQSVGRVMRKAEGKDFGYVILPIAIPAGLTPEQALADNKRYAVVWEVLQALRAHDDRFNAEINKIDFNKSSNQIIAVTVPGPPRDDPPKPGDPQLPLTWGDELRTAIYARMVQKVGQRTYWEDWAKDIADIADRHVTRIRTLLDTPELEVGPFFDKFHTGLRANLNDSITRDNAIEMLAQHIITKPVFDALFEGYDFTEHNPVSLVMQDMLEVLDEQGIDNENDTLDRFYASVANRARGITTAEGKQQIITQLYEKFFKNAFPKAAASLGIVYTPVEIVDFILRSVEHILNDEFGASINDEGVHVLDPFTGTGTFIVRLLQSGLITPDALLRKYTAELHANEISLLAYYVAAVNIEATYHGLVGGEYIPFDNIVLTDTFQMHEDDDTLDREIFVGNNERVERQLATAIRVIVGNPPYSVGQSSANDDNANVKYPTLDMRISETYGEGRNRGGNQALYDSYIRAIRWASDRVGDRGIVGFVTNGGYIDSNLMGQLRRCLLEDFDSLYVYNLRGNGRIGGDAGKREGRPIFEFAGWGSDGRELRTNQGGSRATIAIAILVKGGTRHGLRYVEVGDGLSAGAKIREISERADVSGVPWMPVDPDEHGDWINQRQEGFGLFSPVGDKHGGEQGIFSTYSRGVESGRDAWVYSHGRRALVRSVGATIENFNASVEAGLRDMDARRLSWTHSLKRRFERGEALNNEPLAVRPAMYRPFCQQHVYFGRGLIHIEGRMRSIFPTSEASNLGFYLVAPGADKDFSVLMTDVLPDLALWGSGSGQYFPRWTFAERPEGTLDFGEDESSAGLLRLDNVSDASFEAYTAKYPDLTLTKDDVFYYVYGLLHSPQYRATYRADLRKMLPRIPMVIEFSTFMEAGRRLADLHLGYESAERYDLDEVASTVLSDDYAQYAVTDKKMSFAGPGREKDRSSIQYNPRITLNGVPEDAYRYQLGSRSAIEWVMERYYVRTEKASGIVNDPNDWSREHKQPRYIIDLLSRVVTVSLETMKIVDNLPELDVLDS